MKGIMWYLTKVIYLFIYINKILKLWLLKFTQPRNLLCMRTLGKRLYQSEIRRVLGNTRHNDRVQHSGW